jgi:hypothetical protein
MIVNARGADVPMTRPFLLPDDIRLMIEGIGGGSRA